MPTSSSLNNARNSVLANFQTLSATNPIAPETAQLALLSLIADNGGGGGGGGSGGTQYEEGAIDAPAVGTALLFRRADGTLKVLQGDNSDRIKTIADISNLFALDATAVAIRDRLPAALGATTASNSLPVTLATDGAFALAFGAATDASASTDTASTGFISLFKRLFSKLPAALGANVAGNSFPVTLATDGAFAVAFGASTDASAGSDSANTGFVSLFKRLLSRLTTLFQGTAGTPNANVITVQGITSGTAISVAQSAPTNLTRASISVSASGDNAAIVAGVTAQRVKIYGLVLIAGGDVNVTIKGGSTSLTGALPLGAKGNGFVLPVNNAVPWIQTGLAEALVINLSAAVQVSGFIIYAQEA